jgi:serine/threonine protein phosphatase 1
MRTTTIYCAIGDIHGELDRLQSLHGQVRAYAAEMLPDFALQFIHLGDLIDRGPNSCGVLDYLMEFEATTSPRPITLRGNHEQMMIEAHDGLDPQSAAWRVWTMNGGAETMGSYAGVTPLAVARHLAWLESLPTIHEAPEAGLVFVHAGIDPDLFPDCGDRIRMWTRRREFMDPRCWTAPGLRGQRVVHGHTPTQNSRPELAEGGRRLNIDTGAVYGGQLTAAILRPGEPDLFFYA